MMKKHLKGYLKKKLIKNNKTNLQTDMIFLTLII